MTDKKPTFIGCLLDAYDRETVSSEFGFSTREEAFAWAEKEFEKFECDDMFVAVRKDI